MYELLPGPSGVRNLGPSLRLYQKFTQCQLLPRGFSEISKGSGQLYLTCGCLSLRSQCENARSVKELELELTLFQMAEKQMLRGLVGVHVLRA